MNDPQMKTLASHLRQITSHASTFEAELFPLTQAGEHAGALAPQIQDPALQTRVRSFASRVAGLNATILGLGELAADLATKVEHAASVPDREEPRQAPITGRAPDPTIGGPQVSPAHWGQDDSALAEIVGDVGDIDMDDVLAATVPTTGHAATHPAVRERMARAFAPREEAEDVSEQ